MEQSMNGQQQLSSGHKDGFVFKNTITAAAGNADLSGDESDSNMTAKRGEIEEGSEDAKPSPRRSGRRKIKIEYIEDKNRRHITFSKRKAGIMKKAYELSTLTGTQVLLLVVSETGLVYTFTTVKLQPIVTKPEGKNLIQQCLNAPDPMSTLADMAPQMKEEDSNSVVHPQQQEGTAGYEGQQQVKDENSSMESQPQPQQPQPQQQQPYPSNSGNVAYAAANAYNSPATGVPYGYPAATTANTNSNTAALNTPYGYNAASAHQAQQSNAATARATPPQQHQQAYLPNAAGYYQPYMAQYHQQQQAPTGYWTGNNNASTQQQAPNNEAPASANDRNV